MGELGSAYNRLVGRHNFGERNIHGRITLKLILDTLYRFVKGRIGLVLKKIGSSAELLQTLKYT
jgi:hypothetical protein